MKYTNKILSRRCGIVVALAGAWVAAPAYAQQTDTDNLAVSATVTANCVVTTSPVAFGNIDVTSNQEIDNTGGISVTCTSGTAWAASADAGAGSTATLTNREMVNGANKLNYALYIDAGRTSIWGDGAEGATASITDTGTGTAQASTIYARVPSGQTGLPAGSYTDTVVVTVTY